METWGTKMNGHDIGNELRLNWDKNQTPPVPFFSATPSYTREYVIAVVTATIHRQRARVTDLEHWLAEYTLLPDDLHRDSIGYPHQKKARATHAKAKGK